MVDLQYMLQKYTNYTSEIHNTLNYGGFIRQLKLVCVVKVLGNFSAL